MISKKIFAIPHAALVAFFAFFLLTPMVSLAGPPLICHPYEIGAAKSLPGGNDGHGVSRSYDRKNLVAETLALLKPATPVIVRMETLRRAAIYATSSMRGWGAKEGYPPEDRAFAAALLEKLRESSQAASAPDRALALFDLGFYSETLKQTGIDPTLDGYALLVKAAELRPGDAEIEFALALASTGQRAQQSEHLAKARAAAAQNKLLIANLDSHFGKSY
jgi:hypothetical protein